jgi:tetratricopeptide (TPR) repeat protein
MLISMGDGRLQALDIAWDSRPRARGGRRWFHLQGQRPPAPGDELHWTGRQMNWNFMCAECHTTRYRKNFDPATRRYGSTWSEGHVACEACHGPGSRHVAWAREAGRTPPAPTDTTKGLLQRFDGRRGVQWSIAAATGNAVRSPATQAPAAEVELCARCHSHRSQIAEADPQGQPLLDTHVPTLLEEPHFWRDGQMRGEVYNHASFLQSRMHAKGVTCSDCHEPHAMTLRAPGDALCQRCHAADKYATRQHHHHAQQGAGARCVGCHMPATTYMVVDPRHDHALRVPRPDLSVRLGSPNACNVCHADKSAGWASGHARRWYPHLGERPAPWPEALQASVSGDPTALTRLLDLVADPRQPAIVRASALQRLPAGLGGAAQQRVAAALRENEAPLRLAAVEAMTTAPPALRARALAPLLGDPVKAVRTAAARALAALPAGVLPAAQRAQLDQVLDEYIAIQLFNADRADAYNNLGSLYADRGELTKAEAALKQAIAIEPKLAASSLNLADLYRAMGREDDALILIQSVLRREPSHAVAHHALGLALLRLERPHDALPALRKAAALAPNVPRFAYVLAVALDARGRRREAVALLETNSARHPHDRDTLQALIAWCQASGDAACALRHRARMQALESADAGVDRRVN